MKEKECEGKVKKENFDKDYEIFEGVALNIDLSERDNDGGEWNREIIGSPYDSSNLEPEHNCENYIDNEVSQDTFNQK